MSIRIFIPARMSSTRLPGKPLELIGNKTLIEHVYDRAAATGFPVTVLTDTDELVKQYPQWNVRNTGNALTGTDRVAQAARWFDEDIFVNCQGDLPFIDPQQILQAVMCLEQYAADVGTLITAMPADRQLDTNTVKAICTDIDAQFAKVNWCCRASVSYGYQHVGVYAFRKDTLSELWPAKQSEHEKIENLEQLRWIDNHCRIVAAKTYPVPPEVNTLEDLEAARKHHEGR